MNKLIKASFFVFLTALIFSCKNDKPINQELSKSTVKTETPTVVRNQSNVKLEATSSNNSIKVNQNAKATSGNEMEWHGMGDVEKLVADSPKKIIVDVYTQWCGPCKMMDRNTFSDETVQKAINDKFYPVKFDAEGANEIVFKGQTYANPNHDPNKRGRNSPHQLSKFFSVRGYPTLVVLDENFTILHKIVGYKTPDKLLAEINAI